MLPKELRAALNNLTLDSRLTGAGCFVFNGQKQHVSMLDALKDLFGVNQIQMQLVGVVE
jgi:hypothetical protein